jgi:hypothetical protein
MRRACVSPHAAAAALSSPLRLGLREGCFDVFEGELQLVGWQTIEPFVPRAKAMIVRLAKKVMHMLVEALQPVALGLKLHLLGPLGVAFLHRRFALGNRNVALGDGLAGQLSRAPRLADQDSLA